MFQKNCGSGEVPGGAPPGKVKAKRKAFYRTGKHFFDKGGFENSRGKGDLP